MKTSRKVAIWVAVAAVVAPIVWLGRWLHQTGHDQRKRAR